MNLALRKPMTLAEFLEWEERQPLRYEFDGVGPVAMTGGTYGHSPSSEILPSPSAAAYVESRANSTEATSNPGRGWPRPLSRRDGRVLPSRSNRDRRS